MRQPKEDPEQWTTEKLERKRAQAWELAGAARRDRDTADEKRWTDKARLYSRIIREKVLG